MIKTTTLLLSFFLVFFVVKIQLSNSALIEQNCSKESTKLTTYINYARRRTASPFDECYTIVNEIGSQNPVCFCYFIIQSHDREASINQIIQAKLVEVPMACKLTNTSITDCPKLLKLSPDSPDTAISTKTSPAG
ncbi:hypothetical protein NE237_030084 [Protea cynaroides]|uniref:Bifunctional inhibitor/plant lipid transfer protein/seed storage helical domain-containing protein n=1 Tax=Protea cynaroides TaxID=273540 RepID=A0A9Q0JVQ7_9MAGN|nr:hypothetical protein NE237_030084 [Protea cynaroides]